MRTRNVSLSGSRGHVTSAAASVDISSFLRIDVRRTRGRTPCWLLVIVVSCIQQVVRLASTFAVSKLVSSSNELSG